MTACVIAHEQFPHQMEKDIVPREKTRGAIRKWDEGRKKYVCANKTYVKITSRAFMLH